MIINDVILLFVKQENFLQAEKYIDLLLVLDNAFVSMYASWAVKSTFKFSYQMSKGNKLS